MSTNEHLTFINLSNDTYPENIWLNERDGEHLGITSFDDDTGQVKERNDIIESIRYEEEGEGWSRRYKYIKKNKDGIYVYRSFEHYKQFLKAVEKYAIKNSTPLSKDRVTDDYFTSGFEVLFG